MPHIDECPINIFPFLLLLYSPLRPKGESRLFYSFSHLKDNYATSILLRLLLPLEL